MFSNSGSLEKHTGCRTRTSEEGRPALAQCAKRARVRQRGADLGRAPPRPLGHSEPPRPSFHSCAYDVRCVSETENTLRGVLQEDRSLTCGSEEAHGGEARGRPGVWRVGCGALPPASDPPDPGRLVLSSLPPFFSEMEIMVLFAKLTSPNCCGNHTKKYMWKSFEIAEQILTIQAPEATDGVSFIKKKES